MVGVDDGDADAAPPVGIAERGDARLPGGQWLQVKSTSVSFGPATSAIDTSRASTLHILTSRLGAAGPSSSPECRGGSSAPRLVPIRWPTVAVALLRKACAAV